MRKIEKRSIFCLILAALLGLGLAFFCFQFVVDGGDWASYPYNRHLYNNAGQLKGGTILDRDGDMLSTLDEDGNRIYNDDATVRVPHARRRRQKRQHRRGCAHLVRG